MDIIEYIVEYANYTWDGQPEEYFNHDNFKTMFGVYDLRGFTFDELIDTARRSMDD